MDTNKRKETALGKNRANYKAFLNRWPQLLFQNDQKEIPRFSH